MEQGQSAVGEAAQQLRDTAAAADDRVESAFRRLVRGQQPPSNEPPTTQP
jgi:hypothetical protein